MPSPARRLPLLLALPLLAATARAQVDNAELISNLVLGPNNTTGDIWAEGNLVFVARRGAGLDIVDVSDRTDPVVLANIDPGENQDVKAKGNLVYLSNESGNGVACYIIDVSDPESPSIVGEVAHPRAGSAHNVFIDGTTLYLASNSSHDIEIFDVSDPSSPAWLSSITAPTGRVHDMTVIDGRCYGAFLGGGFTIHDVDDPANPVPVGDHDYPDAFTHNVWPTADGQYLCTTDEVPGGHLRIFDISIPSAIVQVGSWQTPSGGPSSSIIHNVLVRGDLAYLAYYEDGLRVLDVSDPTDPVAVAWYDTSPGDPTGDFAGAWGAFPFADDTYVSDLQGGLFVVDVGEEIAVSRATYHDKKRELHVVATSPASPDARLTVEGYGVMEYDSRKDRYTFKQRDVESAASVSVLSSHGGILTVPVESAKGRKGGPKK